MPDQNQKYPTVTFRVAARMQGGLAPRTDVPPGASLTSAYSSTAQRDLERYYYMLAASLPSCKLSLDEAMAVVDVTNGHDNRPETARLLWAEIEDALRGGLAEKWDIDGPALVQKLRALSPFECMSILDASERAWLVSAEETDFRAEVAEAFGIKKEDR